MDSTDQPLDLSMEITGKLSSGFSASEAKVIEDHTVTLKHCTEILPDELALKEPDHPDDTGMDLDSDEPDINGDNSTSKDLELRSPETDNLVESEREDQYASVNAEMNSFHQRDMKPEICTVCGLACPDLETLAKHESETTCGKKLYNCPICGKYFVNVYYLKPHMKTHTGEEMFKCCVCGKEFAHPSHVTRHMRSHTGDRPYECNVCGKGFTDLGNKTKHMRIHSGEKPFPCEICGQAFRQSEDRTRHMRKVCSSGPVVNIIAN